MLFQSSEARESAIENIKNCIVEISEVPGDKLSAIYATATIHYLGMLIDEIEKEERDTKRK